MNRSGLCISPEQLQMILQVYTSSHSVNLWTQSYILVAYTGLEFVYIYAGQ